MNTLANNWWLVVIRGGLAGLFGLSILASSNLTLEVLVVVFGTYAILDGVCAVASALRAASRPAEVWPVMSEGLVSLMSGSWPSCGHGCRAMSCM
jgi:uncharacterized membrane protein HdeD (DUF308 family)